jgi:hypothetical protein
VPRRGGLLGWLRGQVPGGGLTPPPAADPHAETSKAPPAPGEASIGRRSGTGTDRERERDTAASQGGRPASGTEEAFRIDAARARLKARIPPKED